jgi:hypothetical protein
VTNTLLFKSPHENCLQELGTVFLNTIPLLPNHKAQQKVATPIEALVAAHRSPHTSCSFWPKPCLGGLPVEDMFAHPPPARRPEILYIFWKIIMRGNFRCLRFVWLTGAARCPSSHRAPLFPSHLAHAAGGVGGGRGGRRRSRLRP